MSKVEIRSQENGPNLVFVDGKVVAALCRCGQSTKKPYCSGKHAEVGFKAPAAVVPVLD